jgi:hypothetical protein
MASAMMRVSVSVGPPAGLGHHQADRPAGKTCAKEEVGDAAPQRLQA